MVSEPTVESSVSPVLLAVGILVVGIPLLKILLQPVLKNNPPTLTFANARKLYQSSAQRLIRQGFQKHPNGFFLPTDSGPQLILANKYAGEIHNKRQLSLSDAISKELHSHIPGFEGFSPNKPTEHIGIHSLRINMRQNIGVLTQSLPAQTSAVLERLWTNDTQWHVISPSQTVLEIVSHLATPIVSGEKLGVDPEWLRLSVDFTTRSFSAAKELSAWIKPMRSLVHWFLPSCQQVRRDVREAYRLITPVIEARRAEKVTALAAGEEAPKHEDMIDWLDYHAKGLPYDYVMSQLLMVQAAVHPTADMLTKVLLNLCGRDKLIEELRAEVVSVIGKAGWTQASLGNLQYLDSVMKESQRLHPISLTTMKRYATEDLSLSGGMIVPQGTVLGVSTDNMWDETVYPDARTFKPDRFLKMRRNIPGQENSSQFSSPSINHMGFGYGVHACPGRVFATTLVKIVLCQLLLTYEWRLVGSEQPIMPYGLNVLANPFAGLEIRRREEAITL